MAAQNFLYSAEETKHQTAGFRALSVIYRCSADCALHSLSSPFAQKGGGAAVAKQRERPPNGQSTKHNKRRAPQQTDIFFSWFLRSTRPLYPVGRGRSAALPSLFDDCRKDGTENMATWSKWQWRRNSNEMKWNTRQFWEVHQCKAVKARPQTCRNLESFLLLHSRRRKAKVTRTKIPTLTKGGSNDKTWRQPSAWRKVSRTKCFQNHNINKPTLSWV